MCVCRDLPDNGAVDRCFGTSSVSTFADVALEAFKEFCPVAGSDDEHVAAVVLIAFAAQLAQRAKRVQGTSDDRL